VTLEHGQEPQDADVERLEYPAKLISGAALIRDDAGRVLIVNPTYKPDWEIPGGIAEADEAPSEACRREVLEELGLERPVGRLLSVEWRPPRRPFGDGIHFIFDGGMLSEAEQASIRLPAEELSEWELVPAEVARERLPERLWNRVSAALEATALDSPIYLEAGERRG